MTAVAGCIGFKGEISPEAACSEMLRTLAAYGRDSQDIRIIGEAAFGRNLFKVLPEDDFDAQPYVGGEGRFLLTAGIRIDNRTELAGALGLDAHSAAILSDAALLLKAWERWQIGALDQVMGDYAFAVWDAQDSSLTLARSPFALKPLFYHSSERLLAFASMPAGLHALEAIPKRANMAYASAVAAEFGHPGASTIFEGISAVRPGHAVRFKNGREESLKTFDIQRKLPQFTKSCDWGEALGVEFERAVRVRLRRHHGQIAAQLSSGRDSSAVASTAAMLLRETGEDLLAFTGAPRLGFDGSPVGNRLSDESALAAQTAAMQNMRHFVIRPRAEQVLPYLDISNRLHFAPLLNPSNLPWWGMINEQAAANGATVLLLGSMGNFTISAGGVEHLSDLLIEQGAVRWLARAVRIGGISPTRWRTILNASLGSYFSRGAYRLLMKATGRNSREFLDVPFLRQPYRDRAEQLLNDEFGDRRPGRSYFDHRRDMLLKYENAELITLAGWGLDIRDPTADARLAQLCFAMPADVLVPAGSQRPAYDAAFADRLPRDVLTSARRGYQSADWFELFRKEDIENCFKAYRKNSLISEMLDLDYIQKLLDCWPTGNWEQLSVIYTYRNKVLAAWALASYLQLHFPEG